MPIILPDSGFSGIDGATLGRSKMMAPGRLARQDPIIMTDSIAAIRDAVSKAKAWPFAEARDLVKRLEAANHDGEVLFETGYGPSGLPHIGTFGEVVRTSMVRHAFEVMTGAKTRLVCFSDDMDGLRKVPDNVPNGEAMQVDLGLPLTAAVSYTHLTLPTIVSV